MHHGIDYLVEFAQALDEQGVIRRIMLFERNIIQHGFEYVAECALISLYLLIDETFIDQEFQEIIIERPPGQPVP